MKIVHFVPTAEQELHELDTCPCGASIIPQERLKEVEQLEFDVAYEHFPFSDLTDSTDYIVLS